MKRYYLLPKNIEGRGYSFAKAKAVLHKAGATRFGTMRAFAAGKHFPWVVTFTLPAKLANPLSVSILEQQLYYELGTKVAINSVSYEV